MFSMESSIVTPDDIAAKVGLRAELLDLSCEENCFLSLSDFVDPWRLVFSDLFSSLELNDIDTENRGASEQEKRVASLRKWKSRYSAEATYRVIVSSALKCGKVDNAEGICRQLLQASKQKALLQSPPPSGDTTPSGPPIRTAGEPSNGLSMVIERLDEQYIEIEQLVFKAIKHQKVPLDDILNWIRFLPMTLRTQFAELIQGQAKILTSASNVDELFFILSPYWNSLHPALLEYLVKKLGDKELKARMDRYMEELHHFRIQTTLGDFLDKWVGGIPPGYKEVVLELGEEWRERTVEDFEQFRIRFSRMQSFGGDHMSFMKMAKSSSILVVLALPQHLFPIDLRQKPLHDFLRHEGVLRMMVDGECVLDLGKLVEYETNLFKLCTNKKGGDINEIVHLLSQPGLDPNICNEGGRTLLWWACRLGRSDLATVLLDGGANVDLPTNDKFGESPLITASYMGHVAVCKLLIEQRATVDFQNKEGGTALYAASQHGQKEVVELLLDSGASVDKPNMDDGFTALMVASEYGQTKVAGVLITRRATLDYQNKDGWSALHAASAFDQPSVVELLVESGAQVDIQTKFGSTALSIASREGYKHTVDILIKAKCKPDIQDKNGLTALMKATDGGHKDAVKSLLAGNANPNITDEAAGQSALSMASEQGDLEIVKLLVKGGADVDLQDKNDLTPLDIAKINNQDKVYKFLQKHSRSERKDITEEQKQQAKTFTKRLRKIFDNVEWMFLRSRVLKEVDQRSRESPSPSADTQQHTQSHRTRSKKKLMTFEHSRSVSSPSIH